MEPVEDWIFVGIELDTHKMELKLPLDKLLEKCIIDIFSSLRYRI